MDISSTIENTSSAIKDAVGTASQSKAELMINTTITGLVVVFAVLIILVFVIIAFSKITQSLSKNSGKKEQTQKSSAVKTENVKKAATEPVIKAAAPVAPSNGVSGEIIAVIAAAVASMDSSLTIKSVKRASVRTAENSGRRKAWSSAGIMENTRPF